MKKSHKILILIFVLLILCIPLSFYLTDNSNLKLYNLVENSFDNSTKNIVQKNNAVLSSLVITANENKAAAAAASYCQQVQGTSKSLIDRLSVIKNELLLRSGDQKNPSMGRKQEPEAMLVSGGVPELLHGDRNYFISEEVLLQDAINNARKDMLRAMQKASNDAVLCNTPETKKMLLERMKFIEERTSLYAVDWANSIGTNQSWVSTYLEHPPLAAVFAMLSKIECDARSIEAEIIQALGESVNVADYQWKCTKACCNENNPDLNID